MNHTHIPKKYGWKPDISDHRDRIFKLGGADLSALPCKVDLRPKCSVVENQSTLGSCTANSVVGALEYLEIIDADLTNNDKNLSRLFVYYNTRDLEGNIDVDSGGSLRSTIQALAIHGTCDELLWPYDISNFKTKPADDIYASADEHKITDYSRLNDLSDMLTCLASGFPFVFGFSVYSAFEDPVTAQTGILNLPNGDETFMGGHAVCAVGYDMEAKTVLIRNSWGATWGQDGYFTMPFAYISNPGLAADFWTIRK
jgi:C1A family cysteine protease